MNKNYTSRIKQIKMKYQKYFHQRKVILNEQNLLLLKKFDHPRKNKMKIQLILQFLTSLINKNIQSTFYNDSSEQSRKNIINIILQS